MMRKTLVFTVLTFLACSLAAIAQRTSSTVIEDCKYGSSDAARAAWRPMGNTLEVNPVQWNGRLALKMPCRFEGVETERASWDRRVNLDLGTASGVKLYIWCAKPEPVSHFSLFFKSGAGWYHASFFPQQIGGWSEIVLNKTSTEMEGKPAGWGKIEAIRISAWRGGQGDTEFYLGGISRVGELGVDASVAGLRADSAAVQGQNASLEEAAERISSRLGGLGVGCAVLSDLDVTPERLKAARMVVLPHNPSMPEPVARCLVDYLKHGGKVMAFYTVPPLLREPLGVQGAEHIKAPVPGAFAKMQFVPGALEGAPAEVEQQSWNINACRAIPGKGRVVAEWTDAKGKRSGHAALIVSSNGVVMTHVLLPGDSARKDRMLLALAGYLMPEVWAKAAESAIAQVGQLSSYKGFDQAAKAILAQSGAPAVKVAIKQAKALRGDSQKARAAGKYGQAIDLARATTAKLQEAYCRAQTGKPGEFRAFWCHSAFGVQGIEWDEAIKRLAENGFTAILPNMLWGGVAFYPSEILPHAPTLETRGDQIAACLSAARKYGLQVHVWKVNWNLGSAAPKAFLEKMRQEQRLQRRATGEEEPWLCPSHPANQKLEVDSMVEVVKKYPVDGIHFDYIRYPDSSHCFCDGCKARFTKLHPTLKAWPKDVLAGGDLRAQWLDWRRSNITAVVRETSRQARQVRSNIKISAAVFRNWTTDRDSVGQDWKVWCDKGYLDFVCPMDYTDNNRIFENMVRHQREWAGRVPCYPGIGVSTWPSIFGVDKVIDQILITRAQQTKGFVIFNYGVPESSSLAPLLGLGITKTR